MQMAMIHTPTVPKSAGDQAKPQTMDGWKDGRTDRWTELTIRAVCWANCNNMKNIMSIT